MLESLLLIVGVGVTFICYKIDLHTIVAQTAVTRYRKFRSLTNMVATKYESVGMILWISVCLITKASWISFLQYLNKSLVMKKGKNIYELTYVINGKIYTIPLRHKRGPNDVLIVTDDDSNDMTTKVGRFLGPAESFHHFPMTPDYFDKDSLIFEMADGREKRFGRFDVLRIN